MSSSRMHRVFRAGVLLGLVMAAGTPVFSQETKGFIDRVFQDDAGEHKYVVFVPQAYNPAQEWPVIMFLHGAGERGTDGRAQTRVGLGPIVSERAATFPYLVVFPQCEDTRGRILDGWSANSPDGKRALAILDQVKRDYRVDADREILTGWSMGGYGAWSLAAATPERWAAVVPLAGGGDPETASRLKDLPIWAFHGALDTVVRPEASRQMVQAVRAAGGRVRYDELPQGDHNIWNTVYGSNELYTWLRDPSTAPPAAQLSARPRRRGAAQADASEPFVPALEVPNAVYVRLGNDMLKALAYSIPESVPQSALSGGIANIYDSTSVEGRQFSITFAGIGYNAVLERAQVQAYAPGRLNIQLGLRNAHLRIGGAYVSGKHHSAVTGPISIVIGHTRPAWLSFDVQPYVQDRQIKLHLLETRFDIAHDNWWVSAPAGVSTRGLGMTDEAVSSGLVRGIYGAKYRIEREVQAVVPSLLAEVEKRLQVSEAEQVVQSFWPLPVYKPRLRVWPSEVSTDEHGVSVMLGVTAAAVDPRKAPREIQRATAASRPIATVPQVTDLRLGVAPGLLGPLTELLIDADVARIHVLDIPEEKFAPLADPSALAEAIPELKRHGEDVEIWSEIILAEPLGVQPVDGTAATTPADSTDGSTTDSAAADSGSESAQGEFQFQLPRLLLSLAIRSRGQQEWTPFAEVDLRIAQAADASVKELGVHERALLVDWEGAPHIEATARFAPGYQPEDDTIDAQRIAETFADGWNAWTEGNASATPVDDITFGRNTALRLADAGWETPHLYVDFKYPTIRITNRTDEPFVYETQGPYSGWGGPYRLEPGKSHSYSIPYPLKYRQRTGQGYSMFTLPIGSHSEFRVPRGGGVPQLFQAVGQEMAETGETGRHVSFENHPDPQAPALSR